MNSIRRLVVLCFAVAVVSGTVLAALPAPAVAAEPKAAIEALNKARGLEKKSGSADPAAIRRAYVAASEAGSGEASRRLAQAYERGDWGLRDPSAATAWYQRAAEQGDAAAQYRLAESLAGQAPAEARRWYRAAANQGHLGAQAALANRRVTAASPRIGVAIVQPLGPVIEKVALQERQTAVIQRKFIDAIERGGPRSTFPNDQFKALFDAEVALSDSLAAAWSAMPSTSRAALEVSQPVRLGLMHVHVQVRRLVGTPFITRVKGLEGAAACAGGFVGDTLLLRYADALVAGDRPAVERALSDMAVQIACLGAGQMAELEVSLAFGHAHAVAQLRANRLQGMEPALTWALAPVQLLVYDARKHRGWSSSAVAWFRDQAPVLQSATALNAWPTFNTVYLWNRAGGFLAGHPMCSTTVAAPGCVDLRTLLASLTDPRAIGLGDCALSGMISAGSVPLPGGAARYLCPALPCDPGSQSPAATADAATRNTVNERFDNRWNSAEATSGRAPGSAQPSSPGGGTGASPGRFSPPDSSALGAALCRGNGSRDLQGTLSAEDACIDSLLARGKGPWDRYEACVIGSGAANDPMTPVAGLAGVPNGSQCRLTQAGGSGGATGGASTPAQEKKEAEKEEPPQETALPALKPTETSGTAPTLETRPDLANRPTGPTEQGVVSRVLSAIVEFFLSGSAHGRGALRDTPERQQAEERARLNAETQRQRNQQDCVDVAGCADQCTALGSQIARTNDCTNDLLAEFATALGRSPRGPTPGQPFRPPAPYSTTYDPSTAPLPESDLPICLVGGASAPSAGTSSTCRLILCLGTAAFSVDGPQGCGCGGGNQVPRPLRKVCSTRCADNVMPGEDCECRQDAEVVPVRPPQGDPSDLPTRPR